MGGGRQTVTSVPKSQNPPRPLHTRAARTPQAGLWKNQCYKCKGLGHWAIACDVQMPKPSRRLPIGRDRCSLCNAIGHWKKDCPSRQKDSTLHALIVPHMICSKWNRDTRSCNGECNLLHICSHINCRRATDRHPASHIQHRSD